MFLKKYSWICAKGLRNINHFCANLSVKEIFMFFVPSVKEISTVFALNV